MFISLSLAVKRAGLRSRRAAPEADGGALALTICHQVNDDKLVEPLGEPQGLLGDLGLAILQRVPAIGRPHEAK